MRKRTAAPSAAPSAASSNPPDAASSTPAAGGAIRVGIGGWSFEPWRGSFFPAGLSKARELEYASRELTAIEINSTFYRQQTPATFAKWRDAAPDGFVFSVKASMATTQRRVLAEGGESIGRFINSGLAELGSKLGPIVWQFAPTRRFEPDDVAAFLALLPATLGALPLRHAIEVRHASFACAEFVALARRHRVATVFADSDEYPSFDAPGADFVYARLMKSEAEQETGYAPERIAFWAGAAQAWAEGRAPEGIGRVDGAAPVPAPRRDVFLFFISGAKERAPAAATALLKALGREPAAR